MFKKTKYCILKMYVLDKRKTKMEMFKRLNNYANFTSKYDISLYNNYCENLDKIKKEIKKIAKENKNG